MSWVEVGALVELPRERGVRVDVGRTQVALFRVGEHLYAVGDRCSHAEASLSEGDVFDGEVECPRHGAIFDLATGKALGLPATRPVPTFPVKVAEGTVYIEVES